MIVRGTLIIMMLLPPCAGIRAGHRTQGAPKSSAEQEIRAALCEVDRHEYQSAQKRLEQILGSDPKNVYAQKLLPGVLERQVKLGDKSPENAALIRRAMELYRQAANSPQFTAEERTGADQHLLFLYHWLGAEDERGEMLRRTSDTKRAPKERSDLYAVLASKAWMCSYEITSSRAVPGKPLIEKAKACVAAGLDYASRAITLNANNERAWTYKGSLLKEGVALAGLENDQRQKALYQQQASDAGRRATELNSARREAEEKEWARRDEELKKNDSFTPMDALKASRDLTEFKAENPLDEAVKQVFLPIEPALTNLIVPIPAPAENKGQAGTSDEKIGDAEADASQPSQMSCFPESRGSAQVMEKRAWKSFSPDGGEIAVNLPDNVCSSGSGYVAASEGVMYKINALPGPSVSPDPVVVDALLNTMARGFVGYRSGAWVSDGLGNSFELKFLRKEEVNGHARKIYAYVLASCSERKEGVLIVQAGRAHYYLIDISGAGERDPRARRFLDSLRFLHEP